MSSHPNKVVLFHDFAFSIDDLWVTKTDVDNLLRQLRKKKDNQSINENIKPLEEKENEKQLNAPKRSKNETTKKVRKPRFDKILIKFLQPYVTQNTKPEDFEDMMIKKHLVPSDYNHTENQNTPHQKCYQNGKAKLNEIKIAFVKKNQSGNYDLYFYWNMPTTDSVELKEGKKSFKSIRRHYTYLEIGHLNPLKTLKPT